MQDYDLGAAQWDCSWEGLFDSSAEHKQGSDGLVGSDVCQRGREAVYLLMCERVAIALYDNVGLQ